MEHAPRNRGITLVEILVCLVIVVVLVAILWPARTPKTPLILKDRTNIRGILQGTTLWAQSHNDQYPLPSLIDINDATVHESGSAKNSSANIYSLLIYHGFVTTEMLISPAEAGNVAEHQDYELANPKAAIDPTNALWDPAFRANFTGKLPGGVSYAHMIPDAASIDKRTAPFPQVQAMLSNRGPHVNAVTYKPDGDIESINADKNSLTWRMHGPSDTWDGAVGFSDNHVTFGRRMTILNNDGSDGTGSIPDVIFYDEPDDPTNLNAFLSLFTTAGDNRADFTSIWD